jgi:hypothetical protein
VHSWTTSSLPASRKLANLESVRPKREYSMNSRKNGAHSPTG